MYIGTVNHPSKRPPVRGRILVAEDDADLLKATSRLLRDMGYLVIEAEDGEQALALAQSDRPDLIILDIMMPKLHGIDVLRAISQRRPAPDDPAPSDNSIAAGVIVSSGRDFKPDVDQAMELGAFAFLAKPFHLKELADLIERFFSQKGPGIAPLRAPVAAAARYAPALDLSGGHWKLWGTRGSIPVTGSRYARHGGNTSCLEVCRGEEVVIFDAGSGIRDLGMELLARPQRRITLVIGHTHWDHIQGFPFFAPAYVPGFHIDIYGAPGFGKDLESIFRGQLDRDYFPVEMVSMAADLAFHRLEENPVSFGDISVGWEFMNHPGATIGFRIEVAGRRLAYITDNEFLRGYTGRPHDITKDSRLAEPARKTIELVAGADLLIAEAQYTNDEYPAKVGWGHSSVSNACILAREAGVRRWIVTHHDPMHDDPTLQDKLDLTRQILRDMNCDIDVTHAFDGMSQPL
jgi:CheY-like chemotaxis protein